jgi:3-oxoacyl-[acyl-carrier protein] reductase
MIDPGLDDKVVLVTGANNLFGIGAAIAEAFAAQDASVFITYLRSRPEEFGIDAATAAKATTPGEAFYRARNADTSDAVLGRLREHAVRVESSEVDLADPQTIPQLFDRVEKSSVPVDVLINNAAHSVSDSFIPFPSPGADWAGRVLSTVDAECHDRHFAVNSRAVALLMAEYARRHVSRGAIWGRVVNISTDGADCFPGEVSYGVAPGPIQTGWIPADAEQPIVEDIPLGRMGRPDDVADVVVFLASDQARWVTGQRLFVGGGHRV